MESVFFLALNRHRLRELDGLDIRTLDSCRRSPFCSGELSGIFEPYSGPATAYLLPYADRFGGTEVEAQPEGSDGVLTGDPVDHILRWGAKYIPGPSVPQLVSGDFTPRIIDDVPIHPRRESPALLFDGVIDSGSHGWRDVDPFTGRVGAGIVDQKTEHRFAGCLVAVEKQLQDF